MQSTINFLTHFPGKEIFATFRDKNKGEQNKPYHYHGTFKKSLPFLKRDNELNRGVFFTVNELDKKLDASRQRTKKMFVRARAIWCEDDTKREVPRNDFPIPPNLVVNSSPGKFHYYWLTSTEDVAQWDGVMATMVQSYGSDPNAKDLARVLRLPGFNHCKGDAVEVTYKESKRTKPYTWQEIIKAFPPTNEKIRKTEGTVGTVPGMSVAQLLIENEEGKHVHGPSSKMAMKFANSNMKFDDALALLEELFIEGNTDHRQNLQSAYDKVAAEKEEKEEVQELPKLREKARTQIEWPPGEFGEMCKQAYNMAPYPNRSVAIVTCVGMLAGICGRAFNVNGLGLNLYITLLMGTGRGKNTIKEITDYTLRMSNSTCGFKFIGSGKFTGAPAVWTDMLDGMSKVCVITEAGLLNGSQAGDKEGLTRTLLSLYTSCGKKKVQAGERYSKSENSLPELYSPALSLVQESTPKVFIESMLKNGGHINGDLGRMWLVKLNEQRPDMQWDTIDDFDDSILEKVRKLVSFCSAFQSNSTAELENVVDVEMPEFLMQAGWALDQMSRDAENSGDTYREVMATRSFVKSLKISSLISIFNNGIEDPKITKEIYEWVWVNVVEMELNNIEMFIREEDSSDISNVVKNVIGAAIVRMFENPKGANLNETLAKKHIFTRASLNNLVKHNGAIKDFVSRKDGAGIYDGLEKLLAHMVSSALLKIIDTKDYGAQRSAKGYKITNEFYAMMRISSI